jgi:Methylene-tetrahydrofolate reductase C terminal
MASRPGAVTADPERPRPTRPRLGARTAYGLQRLVAPNPLYRWLSGALESHPALRSAFTAAERRTKGELFGCRMCGQCALPATGYACPMSCPKELRNGPCGGVGADGSCEVYPERTCVWVMAYERARSQGRAGDLLRLQRPIDQRHWGESSWINYWQGRDQGLWTDDDDLDDRPRLHRADGASAPAGPGDES